VYSSGADAIINSGNAISAANVLNVANTNVIGANWVLAMVNIFGDWDGSLSFGQPDLWLGGSVEAPSNPVLPGSILDYTFTIANRGDARVSDVWLRSVSSQSTLISFASEFSDEKGSANLYIGSLEPGEVQEVSLSGVISDDVPYGSHPIEQGFSVSGLEKDANDEDNIENLTLIASGGEAPGENGSSGNDNSSTEDQSPGGNSNPNPPFGGERVIYTPPHGLEVEKINLASSTLRVPAVVEYEITIYNNGMGEAYHAMLVDTLKDENGNTVNEERWGLQTVYPGEEIRVTYTVEFSASTTSGYLL